MAKSKTFKKIKRKILHSGFVTFILIQLIYLYLRFVVCSSKWEIRGIENFQKIWKEKKNVIAVSWHGRAIMLPLFWDYKAPVRALVSPHNDGRIIAKFLHKLGIKTIDGSSNDNANSSALNIVRSLRENYSIAMIPDGPRGPRMRLNPSTIYFAQKSGVPIIATSYSMKKANRIERSWDKMLIPRPFSHGIVMASEPLYIPQDITKEELEEYRLKVENLMIKLQNEADDFAGISRVEPENNAKVKRHAKQE